LLGLVNEWATLQFRIVVIVHTDMLK